MTQNDRQGGLNTSFKFPMVFSEAHRAGIHSMLSIHGGLDIHQRDSKIASNRNFKLMHTSY